MRTVMQNVLLLEDGMIFAINIEDTLRSYGASYVHTATSSEEAGCGRCCTTKLAIKASPQPVGPVALEAAIHVEVRYDVLVKSGGSAP